jgi:hypothetical protein
MDTLEKLNDVLFQQLDVLSTLSVNDEDFENTKAKAETICEIADRVIRTGELGLRNQVWQATRRFNLATRESRLRIGTYGSATSEE